MKHLPSSTTQGALRWAVAAALLAGGCLCSAPAQSSLPNTAFNDNQWVSDTTGRLTGTVLLGQNQIMPSQQHVANDVQPHLSALRDTLVMFKVNPKLVSASQNIQLRAFSGSGQLLGRVNMAPPESIPKQVKYLTGINWNSVVFNTQPTGGASITNTSDLNKLTDPTASYLKSLLASNSSVTITLYDGFWVPTIYLPAGNYAGKSILVKSSAAYSAQVLYAGQRFGNSASITAGTVTPFSNVAGVWVSPADKAQSSFVYGQNFWTTVLPKQWLQPGLRLEFASGNLSGMLNNLAVGAASELILYTIDIGMLTPPRNAFSFANEPAAGAHYEYFQTLPVSRMVVGNYESLYLKEVMMPDGRLLTTMDPSVGGWQQGDMRQAIGKVLISQGIDNANYGLWSTSSVNEGSQPYTVAQITAHNSVGLYSNGIQVHGGSGGAGIVTLDQSLGNEFSHELGHNYGLGHYMGGAKGSIHRPANDVNSTWGWSARQNVFIPNFSSAQTKQSSCWTIDSSSSECVPAFQGFPFGWDAMAGGEPLYPSVNRFTLYTPYSMQSIQQFFESRAVFAKDSPTGLRKWNAQTQLMEPFEMRVAALDEASLSPQDAANANAFSQQFGKGASLVSVSMGDGYWGPSITAPAASAANAGRYIEVTSSATYNTTLTINGQAITISTDNHKLYQSNGALWLANPPITRTQAKKPQQFGVAVTTVVGYYDPERSLPSYVFPALQGGYGFTYADDSSTLSGNQCQLQVQTNNGLRRYRLSNVRFDGGVMNKFHVNVPASEAASAATVYCAGTQLATRPLLARKAPVGYTVNGMPLN